MQLKQEQQKDVAQKKKMKREIERLKRMRIMHNIMECAARVTGNTRADFLKV